MGFNSYTAIRLLGLGAILAASTLWTPLAAQQTYSYALVAKTGQTIASQTIFDFLICSPGVDDLGNVVFQARLTPGTNAIFTPSSIIAKSGDAVRTGVSIDEVGCPAMSHNGIVAFLANFSAFPALAGQGLFKFTLNSGTPFTEVSESAIGFSNPSINAQGQIASTTGSPQTLFLFGPGAPQPLIVRNQTVIAGQTVTGTLGTNPNFIGLNDFGEVVVNTTLSGGQAIFTPTSILAQVGQVIGGKTINGIGNIPPAINAGAGISKLILFNAGYGPGNQLGIFSPNSLVVPDAQGQSTPFQPHVNNFSVIAFEAVVNSKQTIFVNFQPVIAEGQVVAGKTIATNGLQGFNISDTGHLVVQAGFTDNTQGIILATPTEPVDFGLSSDPAGLGFTLDGDPTVHTAAPAILQFLPGSTHTVNWPTQSGGPGIQYVFKNWEGGFISVDNPRSFLIPSVSNSYRGDFRIQYQLSTSVSPAGGGSITPGGFFYPGAELSIFATPAAGYTFTGFSGDLSGTRSGQQITIDAPRTVTANFTPLTAVSLSAAVVDKGQVSSGVKFYDVQISNQGPGNASGVAINQLALATLNGTGTVTNMTTLPLAVGDIAAGTSHTVRVTLGVPSTVTRFRLAENGNFQNSQHQVATFSLLQAVLP